MENINSVDASDSFERWHQVTCRNYSHSELRRTDDGLFSAAISMQPFGALGLSDVSSSAGAAQLIRSAADIRRDQRDHFMLFHVTDGEIGLEQDGRQVRARAGDLFLYDQTRPLTLDFAPRYRSWMLSIPRSLLEARVARPQRSTARLVAATSTLGALAGGVIQQLDGIGAGSDQRVVERVASATLDIVATTLEAETADALPDRSAPYRVLTRAENFMRANLQDPALDVATIAHALNTSPRTLNRAFAAMGMTPMRWLWQQRLEAAYRALALGRAPSVLDVAFSHGFSDGSHFSRAFKKAFGISPRALLRN